MSDLLICGMEMPKSCEKCKLSYLDPYCSLYCPLVGDDVGPDGQVDYRCPLVPVPAHGRLIDADALANSITGVIYHSDLRAAPTIIPASE